jgi:molecular chaperone DnaK (HSP70)
MDNMNVGIDFGTCFSSVAIERAGKVSAVRLQLESSFIPSSVYLNDDGTMELGWRAERMKQLNPARYRTQFKRDLGSSTPFDLEGAKFYPHELITRILRLAMQALRDAGWSPDADSTVTLTVPATHQDKKKELMLSAAMEAGFSPEKTVLAKEPVAAAAHYIASDRSSIGELTLVYDFGGGTFDVAIVKKEAIGFRVVSMPGGIERLGGSDFDDKIYRQLIEEIGSPGNIPLVSGEKSGLRLRHRVLDDCREIKHALSERQSAECVLLPPLPLDSFQISRSMFEALISAEVERTLSVCSQLLAEADLNWRRISRIVMVGGSCRIPYLRRRLEAATRRPVLLTDEPELAVCLGAARLPSLIQQEDRTHSPALVAIEMIKERLSWEERKRIQAIYRHRTHLSLLRANPTEKAAVDAFVQKVLESTIGLNGESVAESDRLIEDLGMATVELRELTLTIETLLVTSPAAASRIGRNIEEVLHSGSYTQVAHQQMKHDLGEIHSSRRLSDVLIGCKTVSELVDLTLRFLSEYKPEGMKPPGMLIRTF